MNNHNCVILLYKLCGVRCVQDLDVNATLAQVLFEGVVSLQEAYHMSVATEDLDKSINYCRIFTEMAESFLEMIVAHPNHVKLTFLHL